MEKNGGGGYLHPIPFPALYINTAAQRTENTI